MQHNMRATRQPRKVPTLIYRAFGWELAAKRRKGSAFKGMRTFLFVRLLVPRKTHDIPSHQFALNVRGRHIVPSELTVKMTKTPKSNDESASESDLLGIISANNRKVSQLADENFAAHVRVLLTSEYFSILEQLQESKANIGKAST